MTEREPPKRWLVYGVVSPAEAASGVGPQLDSALRGAFGQSCTLLPAPPLLAVVAALPASCALAQPATTDLVAYNAILAHVHAQQTIIPLRFGGVFDSEAAVRQHLADHGADYTELLARLHGTEELAVRLLVPESETGGPASPPEAPSPSGTGATYLRARQARYAHAERRQAAARRRADWLTAALGPQALLHRVEVLDQGEELAVGVALLIQRGTAAALRTKARALATAAGVRLTVSGPFPPYSFAELKPAGTGSPL